MFPLPSESDIRKERETKNMLAEIRKDYPEITGEMDIRYFNVLDGIMMIITPLNTEDFPPTIVATEIWYRMSKEVKEAVIAHELGHLLQQNKNKNPNRINRLNRIYNIFDKMLNQKDYESIIGENPKRDRFIEKYQTIFEVYADTEAVRKGYGPGLLEFVKSDDYSEDIKSFEDLRVYAILLRIREARIKNLERMLEK